MRTAILALVVAAAVFAAVLLLLPGRRSATPAPGSPAAPPAPGSSGVPAATPGSPLTRPDAGEGAVEIAVTLVTAESPEAQRYGATTQTVFLVAMNTHSVDLSRYDMLQVSELLAGGQRLAPTRWVSTSDDSHHRSGALIFPRVDERLALELRIKTIAGIPVRTFRWAP